MTEDETQSAAQTQDEAVVQADDGTMVVVEGGDTITIGGVELRLRKQTRDEPLETLSGSVTNRGSVLFKDERDESYAELEVVGSDG